MKKKITKSYDPANGTRNEWKQLAEDEIILMQEKMDELADELGLSEETILRLEKIVDEFKGELNTVIETATITPEMVFAEKELFSDCLTELYYERQSPSEYEIEQMVDITCQEKGYTYIKAESLAEQMKLDEFLIEFAENPYQLKLIA